MGPYEHEMSSNPPPNCHLDPSSFVKLQGNLKVKLLFDPLNQFSSCANEHKKESYLTLIRNFNTIKALQKGKLYQSFQSVREGGTREQAGT